MSKKLLPLLLIAAVALAASARADSLSITNGQKIIRMFDEEFESLDSLIFRAGKMDRGLITMGAMESFEEGDSTAISAELDQALRAHTAAVIDEGNGKTGLQVTGQTYYRIAGTGRDEDEVGEAHYKAKIQAELRWYFLQSSLFGKEGRRRVADLEEKIARAGYERERIDISEFQIRNSLTQYYDSLMAGVLLYRVMLLNLLDHAQNYLLNTENISSDEPVRVLNERLEAERKLLEIDGTYPPARTLAGVRTTAVFIDSAALVRHVAESQGDMKLLKLRYELLLEREKNIKWWSDLRVAPFVRYSKYFRSGIPGTHNWDAGVSFTIPIDLSTTRQKTTLRTQRTVLSAEQERLSHRVADKTALVVAEVEKLNRATMTESQRLRELRRYLSQRTYAYQNATGEYNRLSRAREYCMYIQCLERLIEYQYRRDCLVADLQALLPDESIMRFCTFSYIN